MGPIIPLTAKNFRPFGKIICYPRKEKKGTKRNLWRVVHRAESRVGWRVAYLVLRDKSIGRLECHPDSDETLEPVKGRALLITAPSGDPGTMTFFRLTHPVILRKGVWHGLISLGPQSEIKIVENLRVTCCSYRLKSRLKSTGQRTAVFPRKKNI